MKMLSSCDRTLSPAASLALIGHLQQLKRLSIGARRGILLCIHSVDAQQVHPPSLAANGPQGYTDIDPL